MENKTYEGIFYSRFVASWTNVNGKVTVEFKDWLKNLTYNGKRMPDNVVNEIYDFATNGKFELEVLAKEFMDDRQNLEII
ncbi:MAG: hypothetical protein J6Y02_21675 [Pseudobutyrivibrio sp.]|nr:hypothetical protein [Pseudobutyrivibrio sp.]